MYNLCHWGGGGIGEIQLREIANSSFFSCTENTGGLCCFSLWAGGRSLEMTDGFSEQTCNTQAGAASLAARPATTQSPGLTYELPGHEEQVEERGQRQPLLHPPLLAALPPPAAAAAGVGPAPAAARGRLPLQQGLVVRGQVRRRPVHRRLRGRLRGVVRHHHSQLVKAGVVLVPRLVREVKGTGVVQEQRVLAPPQQGLDARPEAGPSHRGGGGRLRWRSSPSRQGMAPTSPLRRPAATSAPALTEPHHRLPAPTCEEPRALSPPPPEPRAAPPSPSPRSRRGRAGGAGRRAASLPAQGERRRRHARHVPQRPAPGIAAGGDRASAESPGPAPRRAAAERAPRGRADGREPVYPCAPADRRGTAPAPPAPESRGFEPRSRRPAAPGAGPCAAAQLGGGGSAGTGGNRASPVVARRAVPVPTGACVGWINVTAR